MRRRTLLEGSLAGLTLSMCPSLSWPALALAQRRDGWSADGPLDGREPADPAAMTPEERRHVPVLVMPERIRAGRPFDLVLQVGVDPHTMTASHFIDWVEVVVDDRRVFVADLSADVGFPVVRVPVVLRGTSAVTARAHCTLHGTWRTRRTLRAY